MSLQNGERHWGIREGVGSSFSLEIFSFSAGERERGKEKDCRQKAGSLGKREETEEEKGVFWKKAVTFFPRS